MMLDKLVPTQYQWLAKAAVVVAVLVASFAAGAVVQGWQKDASFAAERLDLQDKLASRQRDIDSLESGIALANEQIGSYAMRTAHAEKIAELAVTDAAAGRVESEKRVARLRAMAAKDCAEVLDNYTRMQP